jgi:aldose 1-epimerase
MPAMRSIELDHRRLPTGREDEAPSFDDELQARFIDQGYATRDPHASIVLSGGGRSIAVELLGGYRYLQIYAPSDAAYVCIEPMTAPANALVSGNALKVVAAGDRYRAAFRIRVAHD